MAVTRCRRFQTALVVIYVAATLPAQASEPGRVGFAFLKVPPGARNAGMGDVGTALASTLHDAFFNPAATADIDATSVGFMHHESVFDTRREFVGAVTPLFRGALSIGFDYFKVGSIEARKNPTEEPLGLFDAQDILFRVGYAHSLGHGVAAGVTAKYVAERIESETASTLLFDLGTQYELSDKLRAGVACRNMGREPMFNRERINMPVTLSGGIACDLRGITLAGELSKARESDPRLGIGAERYLGEHVALRAGYKSGYDEEDLAFGAGFVQSIWRIDYAFVPYKSGLGSSHRFALTVELK